MIGGINMKKNSLRLLKTIVFGLALASLGGLISCGSDVNYFRGKISPKFILNGEAVADDSKFIYYSIDGGASYAVALKETAKASTNSLTIPSTFDQDGNGTTYTPKNVTGIWRNGFEGCKAKTISIPTTITVIDYEAFMGCKVESLTIPYTVNQIGNGAFYSCREVATVRFQNSSASVSGTSEACNCIDTTAPSAQPTPSTLTTIPDFCFLNCPKMTELVLPSSITTIGIEAFNGCSLLASTLAFENIHTISSRAFQGCSSLSSVFLPSIFLSTNGTIAPLAFNNCKEDLMFYFSAAKLSDITEWASRNPNWGWYKETGDPNSYSYNVDENNRLDGGAHSSADWVYSTSGTGDNISVKIIKYIGPTKQNNANIKFLSIPDHLPTDNLKQPVRFIDNNALSSVKGIIERLYLPTTLRVINKEMFNAQYTKLISIDSNLNCSNDLTAINEGTFRNKIQLSDLTDLEVIGDKAFLDLKLASSIKYVHLPYSLKYVGNSAFGTQSANKFSGVTELKWNYDEQKSQLIAIGRDAFYRMGNTSNGDVSKTPTIVRRIDPNNNPPTTPKYSLTTLILPKTFAHTGMSGDDKNNGKKIAGNVNILDSTAKAGDHAFAGCPLISKIIIKGSTQEMLASGTAIDPYTSNLHFDVETFVGTESLRTIVIEERKGRSVVFHTQNGNWNEPCIGWNSGRFNNDFTGDPNLQTIVLPNKHTTLMVQKYAFQGNSRAAIYLSSTRANVLVNTNSDGNTVRNNPSNGKGGTVNDSNYWRLIGNEEFENSVNGNGGNVAYGYIGYCFSEDVRDSTKTVTNKFGLNQQIPVYENVHYYEEIKDGNTTLTTVEVKSGEAQNPKDLIIDGKCAYVCDGLSGESGNAVMSKYLYDNYDATSSGTVTAVVKKTIKNYQNKDRTVNEIGESAFSACFCDYASYHGNVSEVLVPDTITKIGDYAFMRAYGVRKITAYKNDPATPESDYTMPSSLNEIGKHAFAFCNVEAFLKIPDDCLFYENKYQLGENDYTTSAFTNNFSLRRITFAPPDEPPESGEQDSEYESTYYSVTHYEHSNNVQYTSALYSKSTEYNDNRLLLVLYRDYADKTKQSEDVQPTAVDSVTMGVFNGGYKTKPCLYGAFKMGYWIDSLTLGEPTESAANSSEYLMQPYFSGIVKRTSSSSWEDQYLYLYNDYTVEKSYTSAVCDLKVVNVNLTSGLNLQSYAFEGCENYSKMGLPQSAGAIIPDGVFKDTNDLAFVVPNNESGTQSKECTGGEIDLTYTKYSGIGAETFKQSAFTSLIAPITDDFSVGESAFENCSGMTSIDFSNVKGDVTIGSNAFKDCSNLETINFNCTDNNVSSTKTITIDAHAFDGCTSLKSINFSSGVTISIGASAFSGAAIDSSGAGFTWPESTNSVDVNISFGASAFSECEFESGVLTLPKDLTSIGNNCFQGCDSITTVTATGDLTKLEALPYYSFQGCTSLSAFDFSKFTNLTTIGNYAFQMTSSSHPSITANATLNLPSSLTFIGTNAFEYTGIVNVYINSSSITLGQYCFRNCTSLQLVYFNNPDCTWGPDSGGNYSGGYFNGCTSLTELWLPSNGPAVDNNCSASFVWGAASSGIIYANASYSTTTGPWRLYAGTSSLLNIAFNITDVDDLYNSDTGDFLITGTDTTKTFWMFNPDNPTDSSHSNVLYLGYVEAHDDTTKAIHFSGGYTLESDGTLVVESLSAFNTRFNLI